MPDMDGGKVATQMKALKPRIPVVMLTAHPSVAEQVRDTVDAFMEKAQDPDLLVGTVKSLVNLRTHSHAELQNKYVVFADSSRRYLDCSDAVCELLGYARPELLNMTIDDASYRPDRVPAMFEQYEKEGKLNGQYILRHKSGKPIFIEYRAFAFSDGCLAAVWEPIKEWKQLYQSAMLELELDKLKEKVECAQVAIRQRMLELSKESEHRGDEWQEIEDALSGLRVLTRDFDDPLPRRFGT